MRKVRLTNGTYHFWFSSITAGYAPTPASVNITTTGLPVHMTIVFKQVPTYSITFDESGLPVGTAWEVNVGGAWQTSTTSSISVTEGNGTHSYLVEVLQGYAPVPSFGSVVIKAAPVSVSITYGPLASSVFPVTFVEVGLPSGTIWSVTLNGSTQSGIGNIVFTELNGSYAFSVGAVVGYSASPSSGSVKVTGMAVSQSVTFTALPPGQYSLIFSETGLPTGTNWSVSVGISTQNSTASTISFTEGNGTYHYAVGSIAGYTASPSLGNVTVNGAAKNVPITFSKSSPPPAGRYTVTFTETGVPSGTSWSIAFNGTSLSSTTSSIVFSNYLNNTYSFTVGGVSGYSAAPSSGSITVSGANKTQVITFTPLPPGRYSVMFTESGLPSGTLWSVTFNGTPQSSTTSSNVFSSFPNATYAYSLGKVAGYAATPASGNVTVNGASQTVSITFTRSGVGAMYSVTFSESGLPSGTTWTVTLNGTTKSGAGSLVFTEPNGTYSFSVGAIAGYTASPSSGLVKVNGVATSQSVTFTALSPGQYSLIFTETGLPAGTNWSVTVGTTTHTSTGNTISFTEVNGTYHYTVGTITGYTSSPSSGNVTVNGAAKTVSITFAKASTGTTYTVTFTETGLPTGASWSVILNGSTHSSTTTTITFQEANGSYTFTVGTVSGYTVSPTTGTVKVSGGPASQSVAFTSSSSKGKTNQTTGFLGLPGDDGYIVIGAVVAAVAIATAVLLMRGRGKLPAPVSSSKEEPERTDNKGNAPSDNVHFNRDNPNVPTD